MRGTFLIEVGYKPKVTDPVGQGLLHDIEHLSLAKVKDVRAAQLYRVVGDLSPAQRDRIASELLADPVVQEHRDGLILHDEGAARIKKAGAAQTVVDVWYKSGVTDVIGESVMKGIRDLEVDGVSEVRTGNRYRFFGLKSKESAKALALALLANPLVHDYVIHAD